LTLAEEVKGGDIIKWWWLSPSILLLPTYSSQLLHVQHLLAILWLLQDKKVNVYLSSLMMKVPDHVYVLG
jgi:hypothetical protein